MLEVVLVLCSLFGRSEGATLTSSSCVNYHPSRSPQQLDAGRGFLYHASQLICDLSYDQAVTLLTSDVSFAGGAATATDLGGNLWRLEFQISGAVAGASLEVLTDTVFSDYDFYVDESEISSVRLVYNSPPSESQTLRDERELALVTKFPTSIYFRVQYSQRIADALGGNAVVTTSNFRVNDASGNFLFSPSQLTVASTTTVEFPIDLTATLGSAAAMDLQLEFVASDELHADIREFSFDSVTPVISSVTAPSVAQDELTVTVLWSKKISQPEFSLAIQLTPPDATCGNFQVASDTEFSFVCTPGSAVSQNLQLEISASPLARDLPGNSADSSVTFDLETLLVVGPPAEFAPVEISFERNFQYSKEYGGVSGSSGNVYGDLEISWQDAVSAVSYSVMVEAGNEYGSDFQTIEESGVIGNSLTIPLTANSQLRMGGLYKATVTAVDAFLQTHAEEISVQHSPVVFQADQGEVVLPEVAVGTALWSNYPEISIARISVVANSEDAQVYADLDSNTDKLEVLGVRTWTNSETSDPCIFADERNLCTNFRLELYHAYDEANKVLVSPFRLRFEFNQVIPTPFIPQLRQWEPLLSNWTLADQFCSPVDTYNNYNGFFVYEVSLCKLGGIAMFFGEPLELESGNFESEIPPNPFTVGQPTMACILFTGITLLFTLIFRFGVYAANLRRAAYNREIALQAMQDAPSGFTRTMISDQQKVEADLSLEAQIEVARTRRANTLLMQ